MVKFRKILAVSTITFVLLATTVLIAAHFITPQLNLQKSRIETWASAELSQPVKIQKITASWDILSPVIQFENVDILDDANTRVLVHADRMGLRISILSSLFKRTIAIDKLLIAKTALTLQESADGHFALQGITTLDKQQSSSSAQNDLAEITEWLLTEKEVALRDSQLIIKRKNKAPITLTHLSISLHNNGKKHRLLCQTIIAHKIPASLLLDGYLYTNAKHGINKFDFHARFNDIDLSQWKDELQFPALKIQKGLVNADIWANWQDKRWTKFQSQLSINNFQITTPKNPYDVQHLTTQLNLVERSSGQWILTLKNLRLMVNRHQWANNQLSLTVAQPFTEQARILQLKVKRFDDKMLAIIKADLPASLQQQLKHLKPTGRLSDIEYKRGIQADIFSLKAQLDNLSIKRWNTIPGIQHLSGTLQLTATQGLLVLNSQNTQLNFSKLFRQPLHLTTLKGKIDWLKKADHWFINLNDIDAANNDLHAVSQGTLVIPTNDSGIKIDLRSRFELLNIKNKSLYLPAGILSKNLLTWLDKAIVDGKSGKGSLLLKGNLNDFPFENNQGQFLVMSDIKNITLRYDEQWPVINNLNAHLVFDANQMKITADSGKILSGYIQQATAVIPQLNADYPLLIINGTLSGDLADGVSFIQNSPLAATLGKIKHIALNGSMQLALQLNTRLEAEDEPVHVSGHVQFPAAQLQLPEWNINTPLSKGEIHFTEDTLQTSLLTGQLFNKAISLQISKSKGAAETIAAIHGSLDVTPFIAQTPFHEWVSGSIPYRAKLILTPARQDHLLLSSDLTGLTINLPKPFNKNAQDRLDSTADIPLNQTDKLPVSIQYGNLAAMNLLFMKSKAHWTMKQANLILGSNPPSSLPAKESGVTIKGKINALNWNEWQPIIEKLQQAAKTAASALIKLKEVNLYFDTLQFKKYTFKKISINFLPQAVQKIVAIDNALVKGKIYIPEEARKAWTFNLNYLHVPASKQKNSNRVNLADIPPFVFKCDDFKYADKNFGQVNFSLYFSQPNIAHISNLEIISPAFRITGTGEWTQKGSRHYTQLEGLMTSHYFAAALKQLSLPSGITSKDARLKFTFNYPAVPYDPSIKNLSGFLNIYLKNGQILDVGGENSTKLIFGRLLSFLSIKSLTRRLKLDFSDLTEQGFSFDKLHGNFRINQGNAYTQQLKIDGPVARINIKGRIGIVNKDYDLELAIASHITSSLPVIAAIAGGPIAGAITWAADRVISAQAKKTSHYTYRMTGAWSSPIVEPASPDGKGNQ